MAKQLSGTVKFQVPGGQATPAPPVGTALGRFGINLGQFVQQFNDRTKDAGDALWVIDDALVDGIVNGAADATRRSASTSVSFDEMVVDGAVNTLADELGRTSGLFRAWQTGYVQNYALIIALGIFVLVSAYLIFVL